MPTLSRRALLAAATAYVASRATHAGAAQDPKSVVDGLMKTLAGLTWDRKAADEIWNRRGGAWFEIIDFVDMQYEGKVRPHPAPATASEAEKSVRGVQLTYAQMADAKQALNTAATYFKKLGMAAPKLPIAGGKFYVFLLSNMGDAAGATGLALAADPNGGATPAGAAIVPEGTHLMLNSLEYYAPYPDHPFSSKITIAHEMVHAIDRYMVVTEGPKEGILEGVGRWWSEGSTDSAPQYAFGKLGYVPEATLKQGARSHIQNIGARPYDYPLTLKGVPPRMPAWVSAGLPAPANAKAAAKAVTAFWESNATYFTSGFWRFLYKEEAPVKLSAGGTRPGAFELFPVLRTIQILGTHINKARTNLEWMDNGVPALDEFLRDHHPTWGATGLHRAFPAFIAHFVEWPDQVVGSRSGYLAHQKWLDCLFMDGVPKHPLTPEKDITVELTVLPLAAKAIRFEVPTVGVGPGNYPPVTITVSIIDDGGQARPIDNIHVGLRGQCLMNAPSQPGRSGDGRVRRWAGVKATPLNRSKVNDETVLTFINVAPDPTRTKPVRIRVTVSLQVARSTGQYSYHPKPISLPNGGTKAVPPSFAPVKDPEVPITPVTIGPDGAKVVLIHDADIVRTIGEMIDAKNIHTIERKTEDPRSDPTQNLATLTNRLTGGPGASPSAALAHMPLTVELTLPPIAAGFSGSVAGAVVAAEWVEPAYQSLAQYGVSPAVRIETDAVQVQVTSSTDGGIIGRFAADFDKGSQNTEAEFRGRVEGRFSLGIIDDEGAGDRQIPEDPTAMVPTDFFIASARAGLSTSEIGKMIRDQVAGMDLDSDGPSGSDGGGGGGGSGGAPGVGTAGAETCRVPRSEAEFGPWFEEYYGPMPIAPADRAALRRRLWDDWASTERMICASRGLM